VVMVTADHQNPEPIPLAGPPPNCFEFLFRSNHQTRIPTASRRTERVATTLKKAVEKNLFKTAIHGFCCFDIDAIPRPVV